jgi:hypothetical protein
MNAIERLTALAGAWQGVNRLHDPPTNRPEDSPSRLIVQPLLSGRFIRLDYTWSYQRATQD